MAKGWLPSDVRQESMFGRPLNARGAVLFIKGDWSEYGSTLGFPTWADGLRPCFLCNVNLLDLDAKEEPTLTTAGWRENQAGEYSAALDRCEHKFSLTAKTRNELLRAGNFLFDEATRWQQREDAFHACFGFATLGQDRAMQLGVRRGRPRYVVGVSSGGDFLATSERDTCTSPLPTVRSKLGLRTVCLLDL